MPQRKRYTWIDITLLLVIVAALSIAGVGFYRYFTQAGSYVLVWSTENELDILGFNVYRANSAEGDYVRLNDTPLPAATDPLLGDRYSYTDETATRGTTYYYKLETLYRNGNVDLLEQPIVLPEP